MWHQFETHFDVKDHHNQGRICPNHITIVAIDPNTSRRIGRLAFNNKRCILECYVSFKIQLKHRWCIISIRCNCNGSLPPMNELTWVVPLANDCGTKRSGATNNTMRKGLLFNRDSCIMPPYHGHDKLLLQVDDSNRNDGLLEAWMSKAECLALIQTLSMRGIMGDSDTMVTQAKIFISAGDLKSTSAEQLSRLMLAWFRCDMTIRGQLSCNAWESSRRLSTQLMSQEKLDSQNVDSLVH